MVLDLTPATDQLATIVANIADDQLTDITPCADTTVADLLDHVHGLALAFTWAADKADLEGGSPGPSAKGENLVDDWRTDIPDRLAALASAWRKPEAWEGMTEAGGLTMPGEVAGIVALDEVVIHGWDLAVASGQAFAPDPSLVEAIAPFVASFDDPAQAEAREGLYGPVVRVPDHAPAFARVLGLTGRDIGWSAPA
jgi:uncharacterized protein (TIGR03086 family)